MDFAVLPPEVNSGRMYAGPGSGPMLAAAGAWTRLAMELGSAAKTYEAVIAGLTGEGWFGPAAESMAAAAGPYAAWLGGTAAGAEQAAAQATAAASAFDQAYAAVMYGYAGRSAVAAAVTPFGEPPSTTNPARPGGQAVAVADAAAGGAHSQLSQLIGAIPQALHGLGSMAGSATPLAGTVTPLQSVTVPSATQLISYVELIGKFILPFNDSIKTTLYGLLQYARNLMIDLDIAAATGGRAGFGSGIPALTSVESAGLVGTQPVVSASTGNASVVGKLAVPPGWVETAPVVKMTAAAFPHTGLAAAPAAAADLPTGIFADMALANLVGRTIAGTAPRSRPAAMMNGYAQSRLERLVTELAGTHEVQHWHVDSSRLDDLLDELSEQPGVHAVHVNPDGQPPPKPRPNPGVGRTPRGTSNAPGYVERSYVF